MISPRRARNGPGGRSAATRGARATGRWASTAPSPLEHEHAVPVLEAQPGARAPAVERVEHRPVVTDGAPTSSPADRNVATSGSGSGASPRPVTTLPIASVRVVVRGDPYCGRGRARSSASTSSTNRRATTCSVPASACARATWPVRTTWRRASASPRTRPGSPSRPAVAWRARRSRWRSPSTEAEALWPHTAGRQLEKVRHRVPVPGGVAEVDRYEGPLPWSVDGRGGVPVDRGGRGLPAAVVVRAGASPTTDGWSNSALARRGRPAEPPERRAGRSAAESPGIARPAFRVRRGLVSLTACLQAPNGSSSLPSCW